MNKSATPSLYHSLLAACPAWQGMGTGLSQKLFGIHPCKHWTLGNKEACISQTSPSDIQKLHACGGIHHSSFSQGASALCGSFHRKCCLHNQVLQTDFATSANSNAFCLLVVHYRPMLSNEPLRHRPIHDRTLGQVSSAAGFHPFLVLQRFFVLRNCDR